MMNYEQMDALVNKGIAIKIIRTVFSDYPIYTSRLYPTFKNLCTSMANLAPSEVCNRINHSPVTLKVDSV